MRARIVILGLLQNSREWRCFFRTCCETNPLRLRSQLWQFRNELGCRGHHFSAEELENALFGLARELLPESAASEWDVEWAHELCKDALARLAEYYAGLSADAKDALDLSAQDVWDERITAASLNNDPAAFRVALKGWEQAGLEALNRVRVKGGAA